MISQKITNQQQKIVKLLYRFRFLSSTQIQKFLNHKNKGRINSWLPDLVKKQYSKRIYDPSTFWKKTRPAVYYLGINGIRWLKTQAGFDLGVLHKLYRDEGRSDTFISTCQLLADICLDLKAQTNNHISFDWATEIDYMNRESPYYFPEILSELRPCLIFTRNKNNKKSYYLLEVLTAAFPAYRVRKRIRTYLEFLTECDWIGHFPISPEILFVCETKVLLIRSKRYLKKLLIEKEKENVHMSFAQEWEVKKYGATAEIWEEYRLKKIVSEISYCKMSRK